MTELSIEGLPELRASLQDLAAALENLPISEAAQAALDDATPYVPVKTGRLAGSGQVVGDGVEWSEPYAGVIFHGWAAHNIVAQPWLNANTTEVVGGVFRDYVQDAVDQVQGA